MKLKNIKWVRGVVRDAALGLCVEVQDEFGAVSNVDIGKLDYAIGSGTPKTYRTAFSLHDCKPGNCRTYLEGLGLGHLSEQPVMEVDSARGRLFIPAQVLVMGLFGKHPLMRKLLLRPGSLEFLASATKSASDDDVANKFRVRRVLSQAPTMAKKLDWILAYPSAHAAWNSIYRHALDGKLAMTLPQADCIATIHGVRKAGRFFVTRMSVQEVTPSEKPALADSNDRPLTHAFRDKLILPKRTTNRSGPIETSRIVELQNFVSITDVQWEHIAAILAGCMRMTKISPFSHRERIHTIFRKFAIGCIWEELPCSASLAKAACSLLVILRRKGVWDEIVQVMSEALAHTNPDG